MASRTTAAIVDTRMTLFLSFDFFVAFDFVTVFFLAFLLFVPIRTSFVVVTLIVAVLKEKVNGFSVNIKKGIRKIKKHLHFAEKCIILCVAMMEAIVCEAFKRADGRCESVRRIYVSTSVACG